MHADMAVGVGELQHPTHLDQTPSADTTLEMLDIMSHFLDQGESYPDLPFTSQECGLVGETPSPAHGQYELLRRRVGTTVQAGIATQRTDNRDVHWHKEAAIETG